MTAKYEIINPENIAVYLDTQEKANEIKKLLIENNIARFALVLDNYVAVNLEGRDLNTAIKYLNDLLDIEEDNSAYDITQEIINKFASEPKRMKYLAKIQINDKIWTITFSQFWKALILIGIFMWIAIIILF